MAYTRPTSGGFYTGRTADFIMEDPTVYNTHAYNAAVPFSSFAFITADIFGGGSPELDAADPGEYWTSRMSPSSITNGNQFSVGFNHC